MDNPTIHPCILLVCTWSDFVLVAPSRKKNYVKNEYKGKLNVLNVKNLLNYKKDPSISVLVLVLVLALTLLVLPCTYNIGSSICTIHMLVHVLVRVPMPAQSSKYILFHNTTYFISKHKIQTIS